MAKPSKPRRHDTSEVDTSREPSGWFELLQLLGLDLELLETNLRAELGRRGKQP